MSNSFCIIEPEFSLSLFFSSLFTLSYPCCFFSSPVLTRSHLRLYTTLSAKRASELKIKPIVISRISIHLYGGRARSTVQGTYLALLVQCCCIAYLVRAQSCGVHGVSADALQLCKPAVYLAPAISSRFVRFLSLFADFSRLVYLLVYDRLLETKQSVVRSIILNFAIRSEDSRPGNSFFAENRSKLPTNFSLFLSLSVT